MYTSHEDVGYDFEDAPKEKKTLRPHPDIDGGWAWMIVLSSFFVHILIMGSQMALGVLNVEWLEEFHQSRGLTAWVSSLSMGITLIVGPFIGLFINTCGCRWTAIVGGVVNALGWVLSAYAASVPYLFITFGVAAGFGSGMAYLPAVVMVSRYFQKRRALAQGLSTTGTGFGTFLMTVLLKYLCAEYGWRNAMFIQGAVSLNLCVCGALMRPLATAEGRPDSAEKDLPVLPAQPTEQVHSTELALPAHPTEQGHSTELALPAHCTEPVHPPEPVHSAKLVLPVHPSHLAHSTEPALPTEPVPLIEPVKPSGLEGREEGREGATAVHGLCGSPASGRRDLGHHRQDAFALRALKTMSRLTWRIKRGFRDWYAGYFGTTSLFTNRMFVAFIFWALFAYSSFVIPFIHLPEIVNLYHLSEQNDAFPLTSIIAIVHIFGKVILGIIADLPCISVWNVFLVANFTLVMSIFILPLIHTYTGLAVICALIGFSSGYFSLMPVVTEDLVGIEHLANAYGIIICANGISALLGPPFAGWIYDITQKYDFSFYISGLLYMVGLLFLLIQLCVRIIAQSRKKYIEGTRV